MRNCQQCGGQLHRLHRTFTERFAYMAIYECRDCKDICCVPRRFRYHFGKYPRCSNCGTLRITKLKERDRIDPMTGGFLNLLERMLGGALYHCKFCRVQFFDRRHTIAEKSQTPAAPAQDVATRAD